MAPYDRIRAMGFPRAIAARYAAENEWRGLAGPRLARAVIARRRAAERAARLARPIDHGTRLT